MRFLLLDNFDSFTFMLKDYIEQCGIGCDVFRNNHADVLSKLPMYNALVISPGPETPEKAGILMNVLQKAIDLKMPILGICLGHQAIGVHFGAKLVNANIPRHGKVDMLLHNNHAMFNNVPKNFMATRYHSLVLQDLPSCLLPTAFCNGELMALVHSYLPIWGIQFHPESCQTLQGIDIIYNFVALVKTIKC